MVTPLFADTPSNRVVLALGSFAAAGLLYLIARVNRSVFSILGCPNRMVQFASDAPSVLGQIALVMGGLVALGGVLPQGRS